MSQRSEKRTKSENLDIEFKKILCMIRERIPYVNSNAYLMQCRVWLEKLSGPNVNKVLRNIYLIELCAQIENNKLLPPFNEAPPAGSLKSLTKTLINRKSCRFLLQDSQRKKSKLSNLQNASKISLKEKDEAQEYAETKPLRPQNSQTWNSVEALKLVEKVCETPELTQKLKHDSHIIPTRMRREKESTVELYYQQSGLLLNTFDCGEPLMNVENETNANSNKTRLRNKTIETATIKNDDSWSDITDDSSDAEFKFRKKRDELTAQIMKTNDNIWRNYIGENYIQNKIKTGNFNLESFDNDSECDITISKCFDAEEPYLKTPNYISEDWKNTIDALQLRLSEMTQQNNELKTVIQKLESQMEDVRNKNKEETEQAIKMLENLQSKEILRHNEIYTDKLLHCEESFRCNKDKLENDYQEKHNQVIASYEGKISEINKQNDEVTRKKDDEIFKLTEVIQQQCTRITNDISTLQNQVSSCSCDKKLHLLKKCISKMDKLFLRSEKEYLKQIDSLRQELEIKDTALQIQLKLQKAELVAEATSGRQEEFDKTLNSLEVKYIKMLEMYENQIMEMKRQDDEKIQFLADLLSKNGISYDEHNV